MNIVFLAAVFAVLPVVGSLEYVLDEDHDIYSGVINWPVIAGDPLVSGRINDVIDYEAVTGEPLSETLEIYGEYHSGIVGADFEVNYMDEDYLDISIEVEFLGAYPSAMETSFLFSLLSGELVLPGSLFIPERMQDLVELCDGKLQENINIKMEEDQELASVIQEHHFAMDDLGSAGIREDGMIFRYDFGFPHVIKAAEPSGMIRLGWDELRGFLLPGVARN